MHANKQIASAFIQTQTHRLLVQLPSFAAISAATRSHATTRVSKPARLPPRLERRGILEHTKHAQMPAHVQRAQPEHERLQPVALGRLQRGRSMRTAQLPLDLLLSNTVRFDLPRARRQHHISWWGFLDLESC